MAITHPDAIRNGIADYVTGQIDVGGTGTLEFQTAGDVEVATLTFSGTAFQAASGGTANANSITEDSNATGNASDVTKFVIKSGGAADIIYGAVATSGSDIDLSSVTVGAGDTVSMSALSYTAPL